ncbi:MAG: 6-phosphogluconolactonase [Actinobacteria bacterium]|nr:MAG: 6-phosphogluconolactonase [Actinomycetota bacterium]
MAIDVHGHDVLAVRAAEWIAARIEPAIAARGRFTLAVSGGSTPAAMFAALSQLALPWRQVHVFQVDERVAPDGDRDRNLCDLSANLLDRVPVHAHLMDVTANDLGDAARRYDAELHAVTGDGVLDLVHLGLGDDGHTASWPPGDPVIDVDDVDVATTKPYRGRVRMTLTVRAVNRARDVMFLVAGADKAEMVQKLVSRDPSIPASRVRADATLLVDDRAAARL